MNPLNRSSSSSTTPNCDSKGATVMIARPARAFMQGQQPEEIDVQELVPVEAETGGGSVRKPEAKRNPPPRPRRSGSAAGTISTPRPASAAVNRSPRRWRN